MSEQAPRPSVELSREAAARCCAEIADVIERYLPLMRDDNPDAAAFAQALPSFRRRRPRSSAAST